MQNKRSLFDQPCPFCNQKFSAFLLSEHIKQCQQSPNRGNRRPFIINSQNQRQSQQNFRDSRIQNQQQQRQEEFQEITDAVCEYCNESYPIIILEDHQSVCEAKKMLYRIQQEEQQDIQTSSQPNRNRNQRYKTSEEDDISGLRPGQSFRSETLQPDGSVRIIIASRDQHGNLSREVRIENRNRNNVNSIQQQVINRNSVIQRGHQDRSNRIQPEDFQQRQIVFLDRNGNNQHGGVTNDQGNRIIFLNRGPNLLHNLMALLLSGGIQAEEGLNSEELNLINETNYNPSAALSEENKKCVICITEYVRNDKLKILPCTHKFHAECIEQWLKDHTQCPICKKNVRN